MRFTGALIAVNDMEKAKAFYCEMLGLQIIGDFGANVQLEGGVFLQTVATWVSFINKKQSDIRFASFNSELYFEENDLDGVAEKIRSFSGAFLIHPIIEHSWGQRALRVCDPDGHIVEIAESLGFVVRRFREQGLSIEETAARMNVTAEYIAGVLAQQVKNNTA